MKQLFRAVAIASAFAVSGFALAAPPSLTIPSDLKPVAGYIRYTPATDAKSIVYLPRDDAFPIPSEELADKRRFVLPVSTLKDGPYRFYAVATREDEQTVVEFTIVIGKTVVVPPVKPPPGGTDPIPVPDTTPYLLIVRKNGPADQTFVNAMSDPAWDDHRKAGIKVRDVSVEESQSIVTLPPGTPIPCTVGLRVSKDEKTSTIAFQPVAMPTDSPSIKALAEKFKQ